MAILFSQSDGSDQHYDTYEEFEQAFILLKRLNGEEVPQDLLDEVKEKNSDKEHKPFQVKIDGKNFESVISEEVREATREFAEALDGVAKDRTPVSDECENPEKDTKFEVGDKVRIISNKDDTDIPFHGFRIGSIVTITDVLSNGRLDATNGDFSQVLRREHCEKIGDDEDYPTEFENDDLVRVTESFRDSFGDVAKINSILPVRIDGDDRVLGVGTVLIGDNHDKLRLVCRREDRKDIEL